MPPHTFEPLDITKKPLITKILGGELHFCGEYTRKLGDIRTFVWKSVLYVGTDESLLAFGYGIVPG